MAWPFIWHLGLLGGPCPVLLAGPGYSFGTLAVLGETCHVLLAGPGHSFGTLAVSGETCPVLLAWPGPSFGTLAFWMIRVLFLWLAWPFIWHLGRFR